MGAHNKIHTTAEELRGRQKAAKAIAEGRIPAHPSSDLEDVIEGTFGTQYPPNENHPPTVGEIYASGCYE
jgi:hypothetical protein